MNTKVFLSIGGSSAIDNQGRLWLWGNNANGQLGDNTTTNRSSPVQTVAGGTNWAACTMSTTNTLAVKTDGTLWGWGQGQWVGDNTSTQRNSPVQIGAGTDWTANFSNGNATSCAIKKDGSMYAWGYNISGALGNNATGIMSSPVLVLGGLTWATCADGSQAMGGITTDGKLYMWGANNAGVLGQSNTTNKSTPIQVGTDTTWSKLAMGGNNTVGNEYAIALKTDGTAWAWGINTTGNLGLNDTANRSSPVQIGTASNWVQVACGDGFSSYGRKSDGTLWAWGAAASGQLGINAATNRSSPVQIGSATDWAGVSSMVYQNVAFGLKSS